MIHELLSTRRSIRKYRPDVPEAHLVERVLEAAILAPSASNKQPWRFFVVTSKDVISRMGDAVRGATARILEAIPHESRDAFRAYGDYFTRFEAAPVVIAPLARGHALLSNLVGPELAVADREAIAHMEAQSALVSTSLAIENLLLATHEAGLGASAMTGPLVARAALSKILGVPDAWTLVCLIALGYPDESPPPTERKSLDHVVRFIRE